MEVNNCSLREMGLSVSCQPFGGHLWFDVHPPFLRGSLLNVIAKGAPIEAGTTQL